LTDRELLSCHAKVKALQNQLGTSYKNASHSLYMAKVGNLEQQNITLKTYVTLKERMECNMKSFESRFAGIPIRPSQETNDTIADPPANSQ
jgi:predicted Co/Zn/Cd cation transporter (cation efflux family)